MTGPEHYREAERLIARANGINPVTDPMLSKGTITLAQVHATLALTAATLAAAEHAAQASYDASGGYRSGPLVQRPLPGDEVDPPYPGNAWGRAIYGEGATS